MNTTLLNEGFRLQVQRPTTLLSSGPLLGERSRKLYGAGAPRQPLPRNDATALVRLLHDADLRGRGGAEFPTWRKLDAVLRQPQPPVVIGNLSEGEPWSAKDHALARHVPQLVLDGLEIVRNATRARHAHLVAAADLVPSMRDIARKRGQRVRVHQEGPLFTSGEASAVARTARTGSRDTRPQFHLHPLTQEHPSTLVLNAETLACIALIASHGITVRPGDETRLATITGAVWRPAVVEVSGGIGQLQGMLREMTDARLALIGGLTGRWVRLDAPIDPAVTWGCGAVHVLSPDICPLHATAGILEWLAAQTAGQCGPCVLGLPALAESFRGDALVGNDRSTGRLARMIAGRGACHHPDGAVRLALTAMADLADERALHSRGRCSAHGRA